MFDILLGRKFSSKCKHSVKYIKCRIETIRKKKLVMVRYLKKDVADLLAGGHDANAFGRIDALIVEINHASCYDMIEQYCGCILEHLTTMCKERDCPTEAMEAVGTLIFAAARFSDLPELADLRTAFTKRYGTRMESCIDKEFAEKMQKKSFSKLRKLQLMEDIAQEFSVNWNPNMFENKMSNQSAPTHDKTIKIKHQPATKENEKPLPKTALQKDLRTTPTNADIHAHDTIENTSKMMTADELDNAKSDHPVKKANIKTKYNQNKKYRNDSILQGNVLGRSEKAHEGTGPVATETPPPHNKLTEASNGTIADHGDLAHSEASEDAKELDHNGKDRRPHRPINASSRRTLNSQPPYRKPNVNNTPNDTNSMNPQESMPKDEIQTERGREAARMNVIHGEVYDEQRFKIKQTSSSRRRHGHRRTVETTKDSGYDKEEEIMDKLLMHYSKKGTNNEARKSRTKMRGAPQEPIADTNPQEPTDPAENGVRNRTRAGSKPARRMPLRRPENEELANWIAQH